MFRARQGNVSFENSLSRWRLGWWLEDVVKRQISDAQ